MAHGSSVTLKSRTYVGLVLSQFLAAFNDQATHFVAIFYATDMLVRFARVSGFDEKLVITLVTASFITPFVLFSPLAGVLADKYSKRSILVFWKVAEVAIMGLALVGFLLPHAAGWTGWSLEALATASAAVLIACVFLMGTHSAFFIPAKYGVMPEILHPSILSRGNGLLEGTSFVSQILGTAFGGYIYGLAKSRISSSGGIELGYEWVIGLVLLCLAVVGVVFALIIRWVPPAAPDRPLVFAPWGPLKANLKLLSRSRPLRLAVVGIAFFTFMTLLMRQTLIFDGETKKDLHAAEVRLAAMQAKAAPADETMPLVEAGEALVSGTTETQAAELRVSLLIALVGLGVGIGSWLAGYLSGKKLELGLVPIGAGFIALVAMVLAAVAHSTPAVVGCLIMIGAAAGLYIVPLYTLLQHRAPKESKGGLVATSNFLNVAGGLVAVIAFYVVTFVLQTALGLGGQSTPPESADALADYVRRLQWQIDIPRYLFVTASVLTVGMMFLLRRQLPDFFVRSLVWMRSFGRVRPEIVDLDHLPGAGPVVLVTSAGSVDDALHLAAAADRYVRLIVVEDGQPAGHGERYLEDLAGRARVLRVRRRTVGRLIGSGPRRRRWPCCGMTTPWRSTLARGWTRVRPSNSSSGCGRRRASW